jgi:hypothetical protein
MDDRITATAPPQPCASTPAFVSLLRFMVAGSVMTLVISTFCPIWTLWRWGPREGVGYHHSLWYVLWELGSWFRWPNPTVTGDRVDLIQAAAIAFVGMVFGALARLVVLWWRVVQ